MQELTNAQSNIQIAVAWFTDQSIFRILLKKIASGVRVVVIIRNDVININSESINWQKLVDAGGELHLSNSNPPLHHKFCIIDSARVITGSFNWTYAAQRNHENITLLDKPSLVKSFGSAFISLLIHSQRVVSIVELVISSPPLDDESLQLQSSFEVLFRKEVDRLLDDQALQVDDSIQAEESCGYGELVKAAAAATVQRQYDAAEAYLLNALKLSPDYIKAYEDLAALYSKQHKYERVLQVAQSAQARGLQSVDLWYAHGEALHELKRFSEAHIYLQLCDQSRYLEERQ